LAARGRSPQPHGGLSLDPERFWSHVARSGDPDACFPWTSAVSGNAHPCVRDGEHVRPAQAVAFELALGPVPGGHRVVPWCGSFICMNPAHLVTEAEGSTSPEEAESRSNKIVALMVRLAADPANGLLTNFELRVAAERIIAVAPPDPPMFRDKGGTTQPPGKVNRAFTSRKVHRAFNPGRPFGGET
jgi:hypothetical protein